MVRKDRCRHEHLKCLRCGNEGTPVLLDFGRKRRLSEVAEELPLGEKRQKGLRRPEVPDIFTGRVLIAWSSEISPRKKKD